MLTPLNNSTALQLKLNRCHFQSVLPNVSLWTKHAAKHSDSLADRHDVQMAKYGDLHLPEIPVGSTVGFHDHTSYTFEIGVVADSLSPKPYCHKLRPATTNLRVQMPVLVFDHHLYTTHLATVLDKGTSYLI